MENKTHTDNKRMALQKAPLKSMFAKQAAEGAVPKAPPPEVQPRLWSCEGAGWDITDPGHHWQSLYKTYLFYIAGAEKASNKFSIEVEGGKYSVKAVGCTGVMLTFGGVCLTGDVRYRWSVLGPMQNIDEVHHTAYASSLSDVFTYTYV